MDLEPLTPLTEYTQDRQLGLCSTEPQLGPQVRMLTVLSVFGSVLNYSKITFPLIYESFSVFGKYVVIKQHNFPFRVCQRPS